MIIDRRLAALAVGLFAAGCVPQTRTAPAPRPAPLVQAYSTPQVQEVMGSSAAQLIARFGQPRLDVHEGTARKLQFSGAVCVLDVYLYPSGTREPVVTHIDTRLPDGRDIDRASCVSAFMQARPPR